MPILVLNLSSWLTTLTKMMLLTKRNSVKIHTWTQTFKYYEICGQRNKGISLSNYIEGE